MAEFRHISTVRAVANGAVETQVTDLALQETDSGITLHASVRSGALTSWDVSGPGFDSANYIEADGTAERANLTNIAVLGEGASASLLTGGVFGHTAALYDADGPLGGSPAAAATTSMGHLNAVLSGTTQDRVALADRGATDVILHRYDNDALTQIGSFSVAGPVTALALSATGSGDTLLVAEGGAEQSVTRYAMNPDGNAGPAQSSIASGAIGPGFQDPTALAVAEVDGVPYAVLASAGSSSLSVMSLDAGGGMTVTDHLLDTRETRFAGVTSLEVVSRGPDVFVLAGGADDGISLMALLPGGRLHPLAILADDTETALADISALVARETASGLAVFAGSASEAGVTRMDIDLGSYGGTQQTSSDNMSLAGGPGDDILMAHHAGSTLTGGSGGDTFIFDTDFEDGSLGRITDFDPTEDSLDLSSILALNAFSSVNIEGGGQRATLSMGTLTLEVAAGSGATLSASDFTRARVAGADRPVLDPANHPAVVNAVPEPDPYAGSNPLPVPEPAPYTPGSGSSEAVQPPVVEPIPAPFVPPPDEAPATMTPVSPGTNPVVPTSPVASATPVSTAPAPTPVVTPTPEETGRTMLGTSGADALSGTAYEDIIRGNAGDDDLRGQAGDDQIFGGAGADTIRGGTGDDRIYGDAGIDELRGGEGHDNILGGNGNDLLYGNAGNDVLTGSGQTDQVFGGAGADFVNGGWGHDRLGGGSGADRFFHLGIPDHGSDWIDDYEADHRDILLFGNESASATDFHVNFGTTPGAGNAAIEEAFVIHTPSGQIIWALVDGAAQEALHLQIAGQDSVTDLYA